MSSQNNQLQRLPGSNSLHNALRLSDCPAAVAVSRILLPAEAAVAAVARPHLDWPRTTSQLPVIVEYSSPQTPQSMRSGASVGAVEGQEGEADILDAVLVPDPIDVDSDPLDDRIHTSSEQVPRMAV